MNPLRFFIGLVSASVTLPAQAPVNPHSGEAALPSSLAEAPSALPQPPSVPPTAADPVYMQAATAAFKATQTDPDVQAAEDRLRRVRAGNALRLEEAELALELVRLRKGEAAGVKLAPIAGQRKGEIESRLKDIATQLEQENAATTKVHGAKEAK